MISPSVVVLDYGSGNIHSAAKALELAGARVSLSSEKSVAEAADGLLVPGVGAFSAVMAGINVDGQPDVAPRQVSGPAS